LTTGAVAIRDISNEENRFNIVEPILEESFSGLYLWHARRTLSDVEAVRLAVVDGAPAGVAMLKFVHDRAGYVYYIAVAHAYRRRGIGGKLLDDAIGFFFDQHDAQEVYASVGEENVESNALFKGRGFRKTDFSELARRYGRVRALLMYRSMLVVHGEALLVLDSAPLGT
jgi:ribosomal protein S18 acetylase RimI-like enzyme